MARRGIVMAVLAAVLPMAACGGTGSSAPSTAAPGASSAPVAASAIPAAALQEVRRHVADANATLVAALGDQTPAKVARIRFPTTTANETTPQLVTDLAAYAVTDTGRYWSRVFARQHRAWESPPAVILQAGETRVAPCRDGSSPTTTAGDSQENHAYGPAFYCPVDNRIYVSVPWLVREVWDPHVANGVSRKGGDFGVAQLVAHEMGHSVQHQLGIEEPPNELTVKPAELQADCLSGVWASAKYDNGDLDDGDIDEAVETSEDGGDFQLQNPGHHGTPEERRNAFLTGYNGSVASACTLTLGPDDGSGISTLPPGALTVTVAAPPVTGPSGGVTTP
jgi:predicted metalloprotease